MAYDLTISETGRSLAEWIEFVEQEPSLELVHEQTAANPMTGEQIRIVTPNSGKSISGQLFWPREKGSVVEVVAGIREESDIPEIKALAEKFGGIVVGEEGEIY